MHSPLPSHEGNGLLLSSLSYMTAPGIGLFFMLSGALLLPVKTDTKSFFKKRFAKIATPTAVWTLFYMACNVWLRDEAVTLRSLLSLPFSAQGNPVLWFIYTLLGLYMLAPIISRWLESCSRHELEFYLCLWVVSLCYPLLKLIVEVNDSNTGILYYFSGFVGYFVLGYYSRTYPERLSLRWLIPAVIVAIAVPAICKLRGLEVNFYVLFWYLSPFIAIQCLFWWKMAIEISATWTNKRTNLSKMAQLTFGIYLIHIFIMRYVLWHCDYILDIQPYILQTIAIIFLTLAGSFILSWLISLLPFSNYIIGYQKERNGFDQKQNII